MMVNSIGEVVSILEHELRNRGIPVKYSSDNIVTKCPVCYHRDGKEKIKLYIHRDSGVYHCFRCGIKGSFLQLVKLLQRYYNIDLTQYIPIDIVIRKSFSGKASFLSKQLETVSRESIKEIIEQVKKDNKTLKDVYNATIPDDKKVKNDIYGYLLKRNISPTLVSYLHYPYFIGTNPSSKLYYRFGMLSFFYTNYEARITNNHLSKKRYIQSEHSLPFDFIFLPAKVPNILGTPIINQLEVYHDIDSVSDRSIHIDELYVVEGLFDAIKINMYLNKSVISLSGWSKYRQLLIFLQMLSMIPKEFKVNRLIFLFDADIPDSSILNTAQSIMLYRKFIDGYADDIVFTKFNPPEYLKGYKDVGDCRDTEELKLCLKNSLNNTF